jgi:lipoprotein-anchoring transpeptidase ErfK/SrfK
MSRARLKSPTLLLLLGLSLTAAPAGARAPAGRLTPSQMLACERRLLELGYWVETPDGVEDESAVSAITAFRRVSGYVNTGRPNEADLRALGEAKPLVTDASGGARFEVDVRLQIIYFVDDGGRVSRILPVSTGSGQLFTEGGRTRRARTPKGSFTVYRKLYGWRESPMGRMYYPSYIVGGLAVHGSPYVAGYPRTHGCVAVPMFAAEKLSELMPVGTVVRIRG